MIIPQETIDLAQIERKIFALLVKLVGKCFVNIWSAVMTH